MIHRISACSLHFVVRTHQAQVAAPRPAHGAPQNPRRSHPLRLLASVGATVAALAVGSVQPSVGQTKLSAQAGQTPLPHSPSGAQKGARKAAATSPQVRSADEAALLSKKLDALEQILVQNQQENVKLRQQLKSLETQNRKAADYAASERFEAQRHRNLAAKAEEAARRASPVKPMPPISSAIQMETLQNALRDLERQQTTLQTQVKGTAEFYRNGIVSRAEVVGAQTELDICKLHIDAVQKQIEDVKAGHKLSEKEHNIALIRLQIAEAQARLRQEQEVLAVTKTRYQAGVTTSGELSSVEAMVNARQKTLDVLRVKLLQESAH